MTGFPSFNYKMTNRFVYLLKKQPGRKEINEAEPEPWPMRVLESHSRIAILPPA